MARRQRLRQTALVGFAISLPFHAVLLAWLGTIVLQRPMPGAPSPVQVSLAAFVEDDLSRFVDELPSADPSIERSVDAPVAEAISAIEASAVQNPMLAIGTTGDLAIGGGAAGDFSGEGLGGGAGGASFFGVSSKGTRFAYIVDSSGSMSDENRWPMAMRELLRSAEALPDNAYFHVLFFANGAHRPGWQDRWIRARRSEILRLRRWIDEQAPRGGTYPLDAFVMAFSLDVPPDVIFFMTDGIIPATTPDEVRALNTAARTRGRQVTINTIAFGEESGHDLLERIAEDSGGAFRFVPTRRR